MSVIRDKYNCFINNDLKKRIKDFSEISYIESTNFKNLSGSIFKNEFYNLENIIEYRQEEQELMDEIFNYIKNFDLDSLINVCDNYRYRFVNIYDYILDKIDDSFNNINIFNLLINLMSNSTTYNGVNLSLVLLNCFELPKFNYMCLKTFKYDINLLEVLSFILKDEYLIEDIYYFIFSSYYNSREIDYIFRQVDTSNLCFNHMLSLFALYESQLLRLKFKKDFDSYFLIIDYLCKFKKALNLKLYNFKNFDQLTCINIIRKVNLIVTNIEQLNIFTDKYLCDFNFLYNCIYLFKNRRYFLEFNFMDEIYKALENSLREFDVIKSKKIIDILNILDIKIDGKLNSLFAEKYDDLDFCKNLFRIIRNYKYCYHLINDIENIFYLSNLIYNETSILILLRVLVIIHSKPYSNMNIGIKLIKLVIDDEEVYTKYNTYINYLIIKMMERNG